MDFHVSLAGRGDLSVRIYRQLRDAVLDGRLRAGERLPPTRELARRLAVSRNTVAVAYDRLTADGFLTGRVGAGTYVCAELPAPKPRKAAAVRGPRPKAVWRSLPPPALTDHIRDGSSALAGCLGYVEPLAVQFDLENSQRSSGTLE